MIVGLTGGIGSGKTTVAKLFAKFNEVAVYIADEEAKKLMNSSGTIKSKMVKEFGVEAYVNNLLNRPFIADIVFNNPTKISALNAIVHPEVKRHFQEFVLKHKSTSYIIYENAILFETKNNLFCDVIITVFTPLKTRLERVSLRDNASEKEIKDRIKNQWLEDKKLLQSNYLVSNNDLENTQTQVRKIHNILTKKRRTF